VAPTYGMAGRVFWDAQRVSDGLRTGTSFPNQLVVEENENEMRKVIRNAQGACTGRRSSEGR
jgi:hypothetical protein